MQAVSQTLLREIFLLIATGSGEREGSHQAPNIWPRGMHNLLLQFFPACHAKFACFQNFYCL